MTKSWYIYHSTYAIHRSRIFLISTWRCQKNRELQILWWELIYSDFFFYQWSSIFEAVNATKVNSSTMVSKTQGLDLILVKEFKISNETTGFLPSFDAESKYVAICGVCECGISLCWISNPFIEMFNKAKKFIYVFDFSVGSLFWSFCILPHSAFENTLMSWRLIVVFFLLATKWRLQRNFFFNSAAFFFHYRYLTRSNECLVCCKA